MTTSTAGRIRILTVDDHPAIRQGIAAIVEMESDMLMVGEASSGGEAIKAFERLRPHVTLMDLQMPQMGGLDAIDAIRARWGDARIIVLTTYQGDVQAARAIKSGAMAYLLKSSLRTELLSAIRAVHAGKRHIAAEVAQEMALRSGEETLTEREIAVLSLVAEGNANKAIAWQLSISEDTVKTHMRSIFGKLCVDDRTRAVTEALRRGVITL
ncbi:response regulator [Sphingomonas endolithica]|uniref:response regulator n=1 Tax=Sphingomonas endolithica TaxID=2972485 RepID=UPI0021AFB4BC|nr:response regulator transcription factor [Sphingomonas sp. ZFBP2030]